ncbi:auxin-responsive protein IAA25-like [Ananas comosus]|uniref:Auxin-responsive protein n=1 Tax=Ananas comosus TaxID=4615 RepID=A0A199VG19_ANACO|nr:auxin-responsive protein IAA25-like [Ananas comosus]OAY75811.1 Auxin-responsive protein IAA25 [Ananas comosus]
MKSASLELELPLKEEADGLAEKKQKHLELRLGISSSDGIEGGGELTRFMGHQDVGLAQQRVVSIGLGHGGSKRCFSQTGSGFVHPWSLAARQQKAALEQAQRSPSSTSHIPRAMHPPPPVVGWPPVGTFRKNLGSSNLSKPTSAEKDEEAAKSTELENIGQKPETKSTMFVKVNMEGYAVGRKINLKAYDSYNSLSCALQKMFHNFLSTDCVNNSKQDEKAETIPANYILLYEDNEGDRMLVGDVPWELFITSVKRLYITLDPKVRKCG